MITNFAIINLLSKDLKMIKVRSKGELLLLIADWGKANVKCFTWHDKEQLWTQLEIG